MLNILRKAVGRETGEDAEALYREKVEKWVTKTWTDIKSSYSVYHQNVWRARLFQVGEFWIEIDKNSKYWVPQKPADEFVPQPRINRFAPAVGSVASNFANVPEIEAVPTPKNDEYAMEIADIVNDLIEHFIKDNALRSDYKSKEDMCDEAAMQFVLSGAVFTNTYTKFETEGQKEKMSMQSVGFWQCPACDAYETGPSADGVCPQCGSPVVESPLDEMAPEMGEDGQPVMEDIRTAKVVTSIDDSLWIFPRPGSTKMSNSPFIIKAHRMSLDQIYEEFEYEAVADTEYPDGFNLQLDTQLNYYYVGFNTKSNDNKDGALVVEAYCEPGKMLEFPEGFYAVVINKKIAQLKPWDELFPDHPLTMGAYEQLPGVFFPRSISFDLCEIIKELNDYEKIIKLHGMTSAVDTLVIDNQAVTSELTGRADKIVRGSTYSAHSLKDSIFRLQHGSLDEGIYRQRDALKEEIENVMATVEVMRGQQPGSVTANVAIQTLRGQAELMYAKPVSNWAAMWKETVRKGIKNYQRHYTFEQLVAILDEDRMQQIQEFMKADLDTCLEFLATSNGLPRTRDEKRQEFIMLYDKGALDMADPNVKTKAFELFGETGAMSTFNDDARRARRNVKAISKGMPIEFRAGIDDPETHLGIALESAKSLEFDRWIPQGQMMLLAYIDSIRASVAATMVAQAAQAMPPGSPGGQSESGNASPGSPTPGQPSQTETPMGA